MSDQADEGSSLNGADQTKSVEDTGAQQAGEDVTGARTQYDGGKDTDLNAKTDEIISKIEDVQVLLDELIVSLGGGEQAAAGGPAEPAAAQSQAPITQTETKDAAAGEGGAGSSETADLESLTDDVKALMDQISAIIEGEAAPGAPSGEASQATTTAAPAAQETQPATAETSGQSAPSEPGDDVETILEDISASLDQLLTLLGDDAGEAAQATEPQEAPAQAMDTKAPGTEASQSSDPAQSAPQSDTTGSAAGASSGADLQILLEDLSGSLDQVSELLGGEAEAVKSADTGQATVSDSDGNASANASAAVNITINRGENGEMMVSAQPSDETPEQTKSGDNTPTNVPAGAVPSEADAASGSEGSADASAEANVNINLGGLGGILSGESEGGGLMDKIEGLKSKLFDGIIGEDGLLGGFLGGESQASSSAESKGKTTSLMGGLFSKNEETGVISGPCRQINPNLPEGFCPLTLDTDKDGAVEATAGMGVDISGDGKADGAATGGDKMLAMSDITGDGEIGGAEVFGNKTVDPFTGEALNAENGFEALQMVAVSAEAKTGMECIDDKGVVNLQNLKQALESEGIGLGMISGDNTTRLESLGDAASIDTTNYITQQDTGDVRHNQLGSYQDTSGNTHKLDDVWF
jgi:hypothetical protein